MTKAAEKAQGYSYVSIGKPCPTTGAPESPLIMKRKTLRFGKGFNIVLGNRRSQAAQIVLEPGEAEG